MPGVMESARERRLPESSGGSQQESGAANFHGCRVDREIALRHEADRRWRTQDEGLPPGKQLTPMSDTRSRGR